MRPVNLLPDQYRPHRASGALSGSAYAVVGVLAVLLLAATAYVLTANRADSRAAEAAQAEQEAKAAEAEATRLGSFGDFATVKETRQASVAGLAKVRFDWERLMRELALVLPPGTTIKEAESGLTPGEGQPAPAGAAAGSAPTGPFAKLKGCARKQRDVARLMVRLRAMHRVKEVRLDESKLQDAGGAGGGAPAAPAPAAAAGTPVAPAGGSSTPAEQTNCDGVYEYAVTVSFQEAARSEVPSGERRVPVALGGGE